MAKSILLTGYPGIGKTTIIKHIITALGDRSWRNSTPKRSSALAATWNQTDHAGRQGRDHRPQRPAGSNHPQSRPIWRGRQRRNA